MTSLIRSSIGLGSGLGLSLSLLFESGFSDMDELRNADLAIGLIKDHYNEVVANVNAIRTRSAFLLSGTSACCGLIANIVDKDYVFPSGALVFFGMVCVVFCFPLAAFITMPVVRAQPGSEDFHITWNEYVDLSHEQASMNWINNYLHCIRENNRHCFRIGQAFKNQVWISATAILLTSLGEFMSSMNF